MDTYIERRTLDEANYIIDHNSTLRATAKVFGVSKSTVHKDVTERLPYLNDLLSMKVERVLDNNMKERHIRGGQSTKNRWRCVREVYGDGLENR